MKALVLTIAIILTLFLLNPSSDKHKAAVDKRCRELNPVTGLIGGCALYSRLSLQYHDLFLFSFTVSTLSTSSSANMPATIGVLGIVFVVGDLEI